MNDDMFFLTYRVDRIAGKPPPTVRGNEMVSPIRETRSVYTFRVSL